MNRAIAASLEETFDNIESAIISGYLQILYAQEAVLINQNTVEVSKAQCERGEKLKNAGTLSESDYAQLVSQYSSDKYQLVVSQNTLAQNQLTLKQLLELGIEESINIATPELDDTDVLTPLATQNEIYQTALACMPGIKYSELNIAASKLDIKSAKAGYYPSLSLSAGVSTGHLSTSNGNTGSQMKNKLSESIGLSLSIPIYNNRDTRFGRIESPHRRNYGRTGSTKCQEKLTERHRESLSRSKSGSRTICIGTRRSKSNPCQLQLDTGKVQPGNGQHSRTAHRKK